jgi:hypothetical protein
METKPLESVEFQAVVDVHAYFVINEFGNILIKHTPMTTDDFKAIEDGVYVFLNILTKKSVNPDGSESDLESWETAFDEV